MSQFVILVRMKTTVLFSATSFKSPVLPVHQVNQNQKAVAKARKGMHQTPKVEGKDDGKVKGKGKKGEGKGDDAKAKAKPDPKSKTKPKRDASRPPLTDEQKPT